MTFVTLVIWVPFDPFWPGWFPVSGLIFDGPDFSGYPNIFGLLFNSEEKGRVIVQTSQTIWEDTEQSSIQESVKIGENDGTCIIKKGNNQTSGALIWSSSDLYYRIQFEGLELTCQDLIRMAES